MCDVRGTCVLGLGVVMHWLLGLTEAPAAVHHIQVPGVWCSLVPEVQPARLVLPSEPWEARWWRLSLAVEGGPGLGKVGFGIEIRIRIRSLTGWGLCVLEALAKKSNTTALVASGGPCSADGGEASWGSGDQEKAGVSGDWIRNSGGSHSQQWQTYPGILLAE